MSTPVNKSYRLLGPNGPYPSPTAGELGGYRPKKIFGTLGCASAKRAIAKGGYVQSRVFFANLETAQACGYRPCAKCLPELYLAWKQIQSTGAPPAHKRFKP